MKSAQINEYGGSEIIKINQSTPQPTASSGKVLVTIKAAGVNPADWKIREGWGWTFLGLLNKLEKVIPLQTLIREMRYMGRLVW
jgi:NADPH:quinone reductase-like Zn-dependent oxidoreductase